jgi:hypothetical protein
MGPYGAKPIRGLVEKKMATFPEHGPNLSENRRSLMREQIFGNSAWNREVELAVAIWNLGPARALDKFLLPAPPKFISRESELSSVTSPRPK